MEANSEKVRLGIVGLGGHGGNIQLSAQKCDRVEVVAVCDPNAQELTKSMDRFGCAGYSTYTDLLEKADYDAVVLVTPNHLHREQTIAAFKRGLDVMVEKPIANTVEDGLAMIEAAEAHDRLLYVAHNMRFSLAYDAIKAYLDDAKLGQIITTEIHFSADNTRWLPKESWRLDPALCPMMPVMQLGVHGIDVIQSFHGPIVAVSAFKDAFTTSPGVTGSVTAAVRFADGSLGTIVSSYCTQVAFDCLDAETIRDSMLSVSGELDLSHGGRSFSAKLQREFDHRFVSTRRSVYIPRFRNNKYELFQAFDAANPAMVVGRRDETILPTQALLLMNHDFVFQRSRIAAERVLADPDLSDDDRVRTMYLRTLARKPSPNEQTLALEFIAASKLNTDDDRLLWWSALQQTLLECVDFRFVK